MNLSEKPIIRMLFTSDIPPMKPNAINAMPMTRMPAEIIFVLPNRAMYCEMNGEATMTATEYMPKMRPT